MAHRRIGRLSLLITMILACQVVQSTAFDVSSILDNFPEYSLLNQMLISTGVAEEINLKTGLTLFAPANQVLSQFQAGIAGNDALLGAVLRYHVGLQYFDILQLESLDMSKPTAVTTLLESTAGGAHDFVVISNSPTKITLNNTIDTAVVGSVTQLENEVSIIQIDQVLRPPGLSSVLPVTDITGRITNITGILDPFGEFNLFIKFLRQTGVDSVFNGRQLTDAGITIFAPTDAAFDALPGEWFQSFIHQEQRLFMEYHALTSYFPLGELWKIKNTPSETIATTLESTGSYVLNINSNVGIVTLHAGKSNGTIRATLFQADPVIVYAMDAVLLPTELFHDVSLVPGSDSNLGPSPASSIAPPLPPPPQHHPRGPRTTQVETKAPPPVVSAGTKSRVFTTITLLPFFLLCLSLCT